MKKKKNNKISKTSVNKKVKKESKISKICNKIKNLFTRVFSKSFNFDIVDILIIIVLSCIISATATSFVFNYKIDNITTINKVVDGDSLEKFNLLYKEVVNKYYEEVDKDELIDAALDGMLNHLKDKYSIYISSDENKLVDELESSYDGIGVVTVENVVRDVYEGSSAYREGVKPGDIIVSINNYEINNENYFELSDKLKENDGINTISVLRGEEKLKFNVVVERITIPTVSNKMYEIQNEKVGYIAIDSFSRYTYEEFQNAMIELDESGINGLILDLRNNNGGYVTSATDIAKVFLNKDKVIYSLKKKDSVETIKDDTKTYRDYKIVVLVNKSTASSAEILASALKDSYGATIIGNQTYGKGTMQTVKYYDDTAIKYTSALWMRANGESVEGVGIKPDIEVDNVIQNNLLIDNQFDKALQFFK